jgi:hypothetical protein
VWPHARDAGLQFTNFVCFCAASRTRHGEDLFRCEFFDLHRHIMHRSGAGKCSKLLISATLIEPQGLSGRKAYFHKCVQK